MKLQKRFKLMTTDRYIHLTGLNTAKIRLPPFTFIHDQGGQRSMS
jgi:hypothetical protein